MNIQKEENFESIEFNGILGVNEIKSKSFYDCTFTNCDFTESEFSHFHFFDCRFDNCNLIMIIVSEAKIAKANFCGSDLKNTIFDNTDLTEAINYSINPLTNKVKNAQFSMSEAIH